jgi:hypothetical protein
MMNVSLVLIALVAISQLLPAAGIPIQSVRHVLLVNSATTELVNHAPLAVATSLL